MTLQALAGAVQARVAHGGALSTEIAAVYAGDKMSDLLEHAGSRTLIVTNLANEQLLRVAELMDIPGICLVEGVEPGAELVQAAAATRTALLVSPYGLFETCGRLYGFMHAAPGEAV